MEVELTPPFQARAEVDPAGGYRVADVPPGEWTVTARAGGRSVRERAVVPPGAGEVSLDLAFAPSREVAGRVSGPAGELVEGAYVRFFAPGGTPGETYSRADGNFRLRLEDGTYRVLARREGYRWTMQRDPVTVDGGPVADLELKLDEAITLRGRILGLAPGDRAQSVTVDSPDGGTRQGQLDQDGGFLLPDLPREPGP